MRSLYIICSILFLASCRNSPYQNSASVAPDINDTSYLKTIKWDSLNPFVDYHIIQQGSLTSDTNIRYLFEDIAYYKYLTHTWSMPKHKINLLKKDDSLIITSASLKMFLLSDSFSNRKFFDCLLKVNSEFFYHRKPDLLKYISIRPKDPTTIDVLINELKKEEYVEHIIAQEFKPNHTPGLVTDTSTTTYIKITLDPKYRELDKVKSICAQLRLRESIANVFFYDFMTGAEESEMIIRLRTNDLVNN